MTKEKFWGLLFAYRDLKPNDNLLIYFAGHGHKDDDSPKGYWIPVDGDRVNRSRWVPNDEVINILNKFECKHILVIADSCFAGTWTRSGEEKADIDYGSYTEKTYRALIRLADKRARKAMVSNVYEEASEKGEAGHSVFTGALIKALRQNTHAVSASALFHSFREEVVSLSTETEQNPDYNVISGMRDEGGDFIFKPWD